MKIPISAVLEIVGGLGAIFKKRRAKKILTLLEATGAQFEDFKAGRDEIIAASDEDRGAALSAPQARAVAFLIRMVDRR